jgi:hypothetical protein
VNWGGVLVPDPFLVVITTSNPSIFNIEPEIYGSDHPAAGPTGPQACGVCYPAMRETRSFEFGTVADPLCPGEPYFDGVCNAELIWSFSFACAVHTDDSSWGKIKTLYR